MSKQIAFDRIVTFPELKSIFGIPYCRYHLARLEAVGKFPKRVHLSSQRCAWKASELGEWVRNIGAGETPLVKKPRASK